MGVIKLEYVIRYSSQDANYKAENLLQNVGAKPWLSSLDDKSGRLEAEFQLDKATYIDFIDIGNHGSSTVAIQVGKSSFQQCTSYVSLLPAVVVLTLADIKAGVPHNSVYMFDKNQMNKKVAEEKWDRVKVICSQPYSFYIKKKQFGLSFLSMRNKEDFSKLYIEDNFIVDRKYERLPKCLSENSSPDAKSLMTRGERILNASKSKKPFHPIKSIGQIDGHFKENTTNFLIACAEEDDEIKKTVEYYLKEFEEQYQRTLTSLEKKFFLDKFKVLFIKNELVLESSQNNSFCTDEDNSHNLATSSFVSTPNNSIQKHGSFRFNKKVHHNSQKRPSEESISSLNVYRTKKKFPNSPKLQYATKEKMQQSITKTLIQKKTSTGSPSAEFEDVKEENKQKDSQASIYTKIRFTRNEDFIQPDGILPSTSSGITFIDCPVCKESFKSSEIEKHASTCGDSSEIFELPNENYFKCPFCTELFSESEINIHAEKCLN